MSTAREKWKMFYGDARAFFRQLGHLPEEFDEVEINGRVLDWANGPDPEKPEFQIYAISPLK